MILLNSSLLAMSSSYGKIFKCVGQVSFSNSYCSTVKEDLKLDLESRLPNQALTLLTQGINFFFTRGKKR